MFYSFCSSNFELKLLDDRRGIYNFAEYKFEGFERKKMIASFSENSGLATVSLRIEMSDLCGLKV